MTSDHHIAPPANDASAPVVSIIIPIHNAEAYLPRCLESVRSQTRTNWEALCIDDGSQDASSAILQQYANRDKRIRAIIQANRGLGETRNRGVQEARGTYILFLDADDAIHPQLLETTIAMAEKHQADLVAFRYLRHHGSGAPNFHPIETETLPCKIVENPLPFATTRGKWRILVTAWSHLCRKTLIQNTPFLPVLFEDYPHSILTLLKHPRTVILREPLYAYALTPRSIMQSPFAPEHITDYRKGLLTIWENGKNAPRQDRTFILRSIIPGILKQQLNRILRASPETRPALWPTFAAELRDLDAQGVIRLRGHKLSRYLLYRRLIRQHRPAALPSPLPPPMPQQPAPHAARGGDFPEPPLVSVLIPLYKTDETFLRQAIESILAQTLPSFELLLLDDCPEDTRAEAVVRTYRDPRIRYIRNEKNLGISPSRNRLIRESRGRYLAIMDHDDISAPRRLALQAAYLDEHPDVGVVGCCVRLLPSGGMLHWPEEDHDIRLGLMQGCVIPHTGCMLRRSTLERTDIRYEADFSPAEDYALFCRLLPHTRFHNIQEPLVSYRLHPASASRQQSGQMEQAAAAIQARLAQDEPALRREFLLRARRTERIRLFGLLPLLTIITEKARRRVLLFGKIPLLSSQQKLTLKP